ETYPLLFLLVMGYQYYFTDCRIDYRINIEKKPLESICIFIRIKLSKGFLYLFPKGLATKNCINLHFVTSFLNVVILKRYSSDSNRLIINIHPIHLTTNS